MTIQRDNEVPNQQARNQIRDLCAKLDVSAKSYLELAQSLTNSEQIIEAATIARRFGALRKRLQNPTCIQERYKVPDYLRAELKSINRAAKKLEERLNR